MAGTRHGVPRTSSLASRLLEVIEEWYRAAIGGSLFVVVSLAWVRGVASPFHIAIAGAYIAYTFDIYFRRKSHATYSTDRERFRRMPVDIGLALLLVGFTGGLKSPAYFLLILHVFLIAHRFSLNRTAALVAGAVVAYLFAVGIVGIVTHSELDALRLTTNAAVLVLIPASVRFSRHPALERIRRAYRIQDIGHALTSTKAAAEFICEKVHGQVCIVFREKDGKWPLWIRTKLPRHNNDPLEKESENASPDIELLPEFVTNLGATPGSLRVLSTDPDRDSIFSIPLQELSERLGLGTYPVGSVLAQRSFYPPENCDVIFVAVNKLQERRRRIRLGIRDFTEEDSFTLHFVADRLLSELLLRLQQRETRVKHALLDEGVSDEVSCFDEAYGLTLINAVKRHAFNLGRRDVLGEKCYAVLHRRNTPCYLLPLRDDILTLGPDDNTQMPPKRCPSFTAFERTEQPIVWKTFFHHEHTGRPHVVVVSARKVPSKKGTEEILETVHDATTECRYDSITSFIGRLHELPCGSTQELAKRATDLFTELWFLRARFYEYPTGSRSLHCLACSGHDKDLSGTYLNVDSEHDIDYDVAADANQLPVLFRLASLKGDKVLDQTFSFCRHKYVDTVAFADTIEAEGREESLDIPIVLGGRLFGKVSVDNFCTKERKEAFRFDENDIRVALAAGRMVAYGLSSLMSESRAQAGEERAQQAEAAEKRHREFMSSALSHDIRASLNAMLGHAAALSEDPLTDAQRKNLAATQRVGDVLRSVVNGVLDMARIEQGLLSPNRDCFDLHVFLQSFGDLFDRRARERNLTLMIDFSHDLPRHVVTDQNRLRTVLSNLLDNAIKFTSVGGVTLRAGLLGKQDGMMSLGFEVQDTGPGIPKEDINHIFRPFFQGSVAQQSPQRGVGLGLAICKKYLDFLGTTIHVKVQQGQQTGTTFSFVLRVEAATADQVPVHETVQRVRRLKAESSPCRVLIVDDEEDQRTFLANSLLAKGFDVMMATNGKQATEKWRDWHPHLILMDVGMPVMDGRKATQWIRSQPGGDEVAIIAVTGTPSHANRDDLTADGITAYVLKPVTPDGLLDVAKQHLRLQYVYWNEPLDDGAQQRSADWLAQEIKTLSDSQRMVFTQATSRGDFDALGSLIHDIRKTNPTLGAKLSDLAAQLDVRVFSSLFPRKD
jgi:signal transduction histidine kinase/DNA-binding response OmpR family regulator